MRPAAGASPALPRALGLPAHEGRALAWIGLALALAWRAPLPLLALGPVLLGVPHLVADLRYLVLRPGLLRRDRLVLLLGVPLLAAGAMPSLRVGLIAAAGAVAGSAASGARRLALLGACALLWAAAWWAGPAADTAFAHAHNLVALLLWTLLLPPAARVPWVPLAAFALGAAALWAAGWSAPAQALGLTLDRLRGGLAPGLDEAAGARLVQLYGFAQAVHYAVWIRLVPQAQEGPQPGGLAQRWRAGFASLRAELTTPGLAAAACVALSVAGWGLVDVAQARDGYLRLAGFHAHLELACLALWLAEGRPGARAAAQAGAA